MSEMMEKISQFPTTPGVYLMKGEGGSVIYVGKAVNLRARVKSYFNEQDTRPYVKFLLRRVKDVEYLLTQTEKEALLLENSLIKKHKPRYNISLKDDKNYVSVKLNLNHDYPMLSVTRKVRQDGALYYGPYSDAGACREMVEFIYRNFKLRTCSDFDFSTRTRPCLEHQIGRCSAPCVHLVSKEDYDSQIKAVKLLLEGKNDDLLQTLKESMERAAHEEKFEEAASLRDLIFNIQSTLEKQNVMKHGGTHQDLAVLYREVEGGIFAVLNVRGGALIDSNYFVLSPSPLEDDSFMESLLSQYYSQRDFIPDEVFIYPGQTTSLGALSELLSEKKGKNVPIRSPQKGEKRELIELALKNAAAKYLALVKKEMDLTQVLTQVQNALGLPSLPERIECYDISNISGKMATGSRVVFIHGAPDKDKYRKYKIKGEEAPDDTRMMYEVLSRRLSNTEDTLPDLLMVDGGKGQLNAALRALEEKGLSRVCVIGIAKGRGEGARAKGLWDSKKEEEIYLPNRKNPLILKRGSQELMLLQRVRDESHRFAQKYHDHLKTKRMRESVLDGIEGLGPQKKKALYKKFKSEEGMRQASTKELMEVKGITQNLAELIHHVLNSVEKVE